MHIPQRSPLSAACRFFAILALTIATYGCGGGGGSSTPAAAAPDQTSATTVLVDPRTPRASLIVGVQSPFGGQAVGKEASLPGGAKLDDALLIGTDASGQERLLRYEPGQPSLGLDSTAFALVKIGIYFAELPEEAQVSDVLPFIRKTNSYPALAEAIRASLATNSTSPLTDSSVADAAGNVINDAIAAYVASIPAAAAKAQVSSSVTQLPFYLWDVNASDKGWLVDGPKLTFKNRTFLAWELHTDPAIATVIANPIKKTYRQLAANYANSETSTSLSEPDKRFLLYVEQTQRTQVINVKNIITKSTTAMVEIAFGFAGIKDPGLIKGCVAKTVSDLISTDDFANLVANYSGPAFFDYTKSQFSIGNMVKIAKNCSVSNFNISDLLYASLVKFYDALVAARTSAAAYGTVAQMNKYRVATMDEPSGFKTEICRYNGVVSKCIARLEAQSIQLNVGDSVIPTIKAFDAAVGGKELPLPSTLGYSSDNEAIASLQLGKVVANAPGEAHTTVRDSVSGVFTTLTIVVIQKAVVKSNLKIDLSTNRYGCTIGRGTETNTSPAYDYKISSCIGGSLDTVITCVTQFCYYSDLIVDIKYDYAYGPSSDPDKSAICGSANHLQTTRSQLSVPFSDFYTIDRVIYSGCQYSKYILSVIVSVKDSNGNVVSQSGNFTLEAPGF